MNRAHTPNGSESRRGSIFVEGRHGTRQHADTLTLLPHMRQQLTTPKAAKKKKRKKKRNTLALPAELPNEFSATDGIHRQTQGRLEAGDHSIGRLEGGDHYIGSFTSCTRLMAGTPTSRPSLLPSESNLHSLKPPQSNAKTAGE